MTDHPALNAFVSNIQFIPSDFITVKSAAKWDDLGFDDQKYVINGKYFNMKKINGKKYICRARLNRFIESGLNKVYYIDMD